jgi:phage-related protein
MIDSRRISWIKAARRDFEAFPEAVQADVLDALALVALEVMPTKAKPLVGLEGGVFEIALRHRTDAFRAVYAIKIDSDIWVVHAFQKKSKSGIATPKHEIDVIRERLKRLREALA